MFRYTFCAFIFLFLSGCASVQPMSTTSLSEFKNGKSAVAFFDGVEGITFIEDKYLVLGVVQVASNSVYQGFWDSNKDISALHAAEFSNIGVRAQSLYDVLTENEKPEFIAIQKEMYVAASVDNNRDNKNELSLFLNPKLRERLLEKGYDYLIWMTWSGYLLHIHALTVPPHEEFYTTYWIQDLKKNSTIWHGKIWFREKIEFEGSSGKAFLEKNNLSGLKNEVERMVKERYKVRTGRGLLNDSVGQIIGLEPRVKP